MNTLRAATLAARAVDPNIGVRAEFGKFTIVRAVQRKGGSHDVTVIAGPMPGWQAVDALNAIARSAS